MMRTQNHHHHNHDHDRDHQQQQSRVLYDLSSLVLNILRHPPSPSTLNFSDFISPPPPPPPALRSPRLARAPPPPQITAGGFASLMLGISLALMLCGSVTFFIGFMLLPWVIGLVMVFYFVGLVTSISVLGRALLCYATSSSSTPRKDFPGWKFL